MDDLTGIGPYSAYPRTSAVEANQVVNLVGAPYACPNYAGAQPGRVPEQGADVAVPRGRPSDRDRGHRRPGRPGRSAARHGPGGDPAAQSDPRRRLSVRLAVRPAVRGAVAPRLARQAAGHDGLPRRCGPNRRRCGHAGIYRGHRARELHRDHQSRAGVLRRGRRAHLGAGRRHGPVRCARRGDLPGERHRAGSGHRGRAGPDRRRRRSASTRRACGSCSAIPTPPPMAAAPGRRAARASAARPRGRPACALRENALRLAGSILQATPDALDLAGRRGGGQGHGTRADHAAGAGAHRLFPPRYAARWACRRS